MRRHRRQITQNSDACGTFSNQAKKKKKEKKKDKENR